MKYLILLIIFSCSLQAKKTKCEQQTFGEWTVISSVDDFEGEIDVHLKSSIKSLVGANIGNMNLNYYRLTSSPFVSMNIRGLDGTWPACDYEFMKYKVDNHESDYFPTTGHTCPTLVLVSDIKKQFLKGHKFRISARGTTGEVSLTGFAKAWKSATKSLSSKKCLKNKPKVNLIEKASQNILSKYKGSEISFVNFNMFTKNETIYHVCGTLTYNENNGISEVSKYFVELFDTGNISRSMIKKKTDIKNFNFLWDIYCIKNDENVLVKSN